MTKRAQPVVTPFFEKDSSTFSYLVKDPNSQFCAIIDSVLNFDYASGQVSFDTANEIINFVKRNQLELSYIIETHVHADHLSAAPYLQEQLGGKIAISEKIHIIQKEFGKLFNENTDFQRDGSQFDVLFEDGQTYQIGSLTCMAMLTPGHTPACMSHLIGDAVFVGDTIFMPDGGTARADFPGGDARMLYQSIQKIFELPDETRVFVCHDYQPAGRKLQCQCSVKDQKNNNIHIHTKISEDEFVAMRQTRDKTLGMPRLIFPSLQTNMRAGHFPEAEENQMIYLKVPITTSID